MIFLIIIGSPVKNMGSQAMVRSLSHCLKTHFPNASVTVMASEQEFRVNLKLPDVDEYLYRYSFTSDKITIKRILNKLYFLLTHKQSKRLLMHSYLKAAKKADAVFIIGGDNYDISYQSLRYMREVTDFISEIGPRKAVMYNCSFAKKDLTPEVLSDLSAFRFLTARDVISFQNLKDAMPEKTIRYYPDIAFAMEPEAVPLPEYWEPGNMIGINLSSLVGDGRYGASEEEILLAYERMLDMILERTGLKICLIPHVKQDADLSVLRKLYASLPDKSRALLISHENYNAAQKKYIISQCRLFVGARTHATIAAYSSCVPTLVVGYSVKSLGIAKDLFGTHEGYVVSIPALKNPDALADAFSVFLRREQRMRKALEEKKPGYIRAAAQGVDDLLGEIIGLRSGGTAK